jgi:2-polyprenyl-3-methyl-5-hydroxy-6-metoxy-1,4-benzoquinol methylase
MTDIASQVRKFYGDIKFPGLYTINDLDFYQENIHNDFLSSYNNGVKNCTTVLDVGCGTGFITNLLAIKNPNLKIDAIDFSDSIEFANEFSKLNNITNITYYKEDFFNFKTDQQYDCIICNGVLHHMPEYENAINKFKNMIAPNGKLILGVYNRLGKTVKKVIPVTYRSELLRADQEDVPYETNFSNKEFLNYFLDFNIDSIHPSFNNQLVDLSNLLNYKNGGLTVYSLTRKTNG